MSALRIWEALAAIVILSVSPTLAEDRHEWIQKWHLFSDQNAVSLEETHTAATLSTARGSVFGALCLTKIRTYAFFIEDKMLKTLPFGSKVTLVARFSNEKPFDLLAVSNGEGRVLVEKRLAKTSFGLLALTMQTYDQSAFIGFALGGHQWLFPTDGAPASLD